jgi:hypothetical protein
MSELAHVADGLRQLRQEAGEVERQLTEAERQLAQARAELSGQVSRDPSKRARRRLGLVDEAERRVRAARAQLRNGAAAADGWLAQHDASGDHEGGGAPSPPPPLFGDGANGSDAVYAAVHRANARRVAGDPDAAHDALAAELDALEQAGAAPRLRRARAWGGERAGGRNAYAEELRDPEPDATYVVEGAEGHVFQFETDARGRTVRARTTLELLDQPRSETLQGSAKRGKGGDASDDGGHLIGNVFGGPSEEINVVPQDWFQNQQGAWHRLEREWQRLKQTGHDVEVQIEPRYEGDGERPVELIVVWAFRPRGVPPSEWVKDRVRIPNDHAAGPRRGGSPPGRG